MKTLLIIAAAFMAGQLYAFTINGVVKIRNDSLPCVAAVTVEHDPRYVETVALLEKMRLPIGGR